MVDKDMLIDKKQFLDRYPGISKWGLDWLIRNRRIPIVKISKRIYFSVHDIDEWIEKHKIQPIDKVGNPARIYND